MIEIRPMKKDDLEFVVNLEKELFSDAWSYQMLSDEMASPFGKNFVLTESEVPCAYGIFRFLAGEGEVLRIGTSPEKRRRGFARALLVHYLAEIETYENVFLEVRAGNTPARNLYESLGFREIAVRADYYRNPTEDAVIYEKK